MKDLKKIITCLIILGAFMSMTTANAQIVASSTSVSTLVKNDGMISSNASAVSSPYSISKDTVPSFYDYVVSYSSESKIGAFSMGSTVGKYGYIDLGCSFGFGDISYTDFRFGLGVSKRYIFDSGFMIVGKLYPYISYETYRVTELNEKGKEENKDKSKVSYGAAGCLAAGIKCWTTKKGNNAYLTIGYYVNAAEFETKDLIKLGSWQFGFSVGI